MMNGVLPTLTWGTWDDTDWANTKGTTEQPVAAALPMTVDGATLSKKQRSVRKLRQKALQAPTKSQLWFEELLERLESTSFGRDQATYHCNPLKCLHRVGKSRGETATTIPWADLPDGSHPRDGKLPPQRARNKQHQVDNLAVFLKRILR